MENALVHAHMLLFMFLNDNQPFLNVAVIKNPNHKTDYE